MKVANVLYNPNIQNYITDYPAVKNKFGDNFAEITKLGLFADPIIVKSRDKYIACGVFGNKYSESYSFYFKTQRNEILINEFENYRQYIEVLFCMVDGTANYLDPSGPIRNADISDFNNCVIILVSDKYFYVIRDAEGLDVKKFDRVGNNKYSGFPRFEISSDGSKICVNEGDYGDLFNYQYLDFDADPIIQRSCQERIRQKKDTFDSMHSHLYFSLNHSKESIIAFKYSKEKLSPVYLKNEFKDDDSINVDVTINNNNIEAIGILGKIATRNIENYLIYGISPINILIAYMKAPGYRDLKKTISDDSIKTYEEIFTKFMDAHNLNEIETAKYIYTN